MILGLILAVGSALGTNAGFLFKQRGAVLAPPIRLSRPLHSAADLFRSKWFMVGWIVSFVAWGLHVGALSLASLSTVQAACREGWSSSRSLPSGTSAFTSGDANGPG